MGENTIRVSDFSVGANTTVSGITSTPQWSEMNEAIVDGGGCQRRSGRVKMYQFPVTSTIIDFDGTNDTVTFPSTPVISPLGLRWTFKTLFVTDSIASNQTILGYPSATVRAFKIVHNTSSQVVVTIADSALTTTTLTWTGISAGTVCALQVARDGATITGYLNGVVQSGSISASLSLAPLIQTFGASNGADFFDGGIDFFRILSTYETSQADGWCRSMFPRNENTLLDLILTIDSASTYVLDRSANEAHMTTSGSPATNRAAIAYNADPVRALSNNMDSSNARQAYAVVGDRVYPYRVA